VRIHTHMARSACFSACIVLVLSFVASLILAVFQGGFISSPVSDRSVSAFSSMSAMQLTYPEPDVLQSDKHTATVIMLHGLGDTSAGWSPVGLQLRGQLPHIKWIFPTAPTVQFLLVSDLLYDPVCSCVMLRYPASAKLHTTAQCTMCAETHHLQWWHEDAGLV
jgi:hypothetical protein